MYANRICEAKEAASVTPEGGIGTYMERSQHRILKYFLEPDPSYHEIPVHTYIADICKNGHIYEIQTSGFGNLTAKLEVFLKDHQVTVIYPAAVKKTVVWTDPETGETTEGRAVLKRAVRFKLLSELLHIRELVGRKGFSVCVLETEVRSYRLLDGRGADRKIKATKVDTVPDNILCETHINHISDLKSFAGLITDEEYTREALGKKLSLRNRNLSAAIKMLLLSGIIYEYGRRDRKIIYRVR